MWFIATDNYFYLTTANMLPFPRPYVGPRDFGNDFRRGS